MGFHVGKLVICVDDSDCACSHGCKNEARRGIVYTVCEVIERNGELGINLHELPTPRPHVGYVARLFRPLKDSALDVFRDIAANPPKQPDKYVHPALPRRREEVA